MDNENKTANIIDRFISLYFDGLNPNWSELSLCAYYIVVVDNFMSFRPMTTKFSDLFE